MLIFYPRISNGNILWTCDNCGKTAEVSTPDTNVAALVCECDMVCHPKCNHDWYYKGLYWNRIPMENRDRYIKERMKKSEKKA
jgi:hypothetical protein